MIDDKGLGRAGLIVFVASQESDVVDGSLSQACQAGEGCLSYILALPPPLGKGSTAAPLGTFSKAIEPFSIGKLIPAC